MEPSQFYTGLVAELYAALRSEAPNADVYAQFVQRHGEPALELGCGHGDPLLDLRLRGLQVEGLDSSADMLERCRGRARELGVEVALHHAAIETMDLGRTYRTIFLAGATFNLLPTDDAALEALRRIRAHLGPGDTALIPLTIPAPVPEQNLYDTREALTAEGAVMRFSTVSSTRDEEARLQKAVLRYELEGTELQSLEREWVLHWHTQDGFSALVEDAALETVAVVGADGAPARGDARSFAFILRRP